METLWQDLRYAIRMLVKAPAFSAIAIVTLALGIGANTALFSVINAVLVRMLPVKHPEQLVYIGNPSRVHGTSTGSPRVDLFSYPFYRELATHAQGFEEIAATGRPPRALVGTDSSPANGDKARVRLVTSNYFTMLGVEPVLGRTFNEQSPSAPGSNPVLVLSYPYWQQHYSGDPNIVGRTLYVNGYPLTVVGVTPPQFFGEVVGETQDLYVPMSMQEQITPGRKWLDDKRVSWLMMLARLKPGVSVAQARANVNLAFQQIAHSSWADEFDREEREHLAKKNIDVGPGGRGLSSLRANFTRPLLILMAIVGLVLLITCFNVANLLLARSSARQKEIAVRLAIGASGWRLTRQLLTESVVLAFIGGAVGIVISSWGTRVLLGFASAFGAGKGFEAGVDLTVLAFTAGLCLLTGVLFGLAPAIHSRRVEVMPTLKDASRIVTTAHGPSRFATSKLLVAGQVALSILVVFAAGLLVLTLKNLQRVNMGYNPQRLVVMSVDPITAGLGGPKLNPYCQELATRIKSLPNVQAVSYSENGVFSGTESADTVIVEGYTPKNDDDRVVWDDMVGPNYFQALGVPILLGRDIGPQDTATSQRVIVINQAAARKYFGDANPLGRHIAMDDEKEKNNPFTIVGVAGDARDHSLRDVVLPRAYAPVAQVVNQMLGGGGMKFEVRTTSDPAALVNSLRTVVRNLNPAVPINDIDPLPSLLDDYLREELMVAKLSTLLAGLALVLACVGLYGITSYSVAGRTREIGVRMALGAKRTDVLWLVLREALWLVAAGVVVGVPVAIAGSRLLGAVLYGVSATNPIFLIGPAFLLIAVALFAAAVPARRATQVDPMVALRYE
jgi:predicted permease